MGPQQHNRAALSLPEPTLIQQITLMHKNTDAQFNKF